MVIKAQSPAGFAEEYIIERSGITASLPDRFSPLNASFLS